MALKLLQSIISNIHSFDDFEEAYSGAFESEEDFVYDVAHDVYSEE